MATESPLINDGNNTTAAADLSTKQFYAVKLTAARAVNLASANTDSIYGILQNKPKSGEAADVGIFGISKAVAGAAISAGAALMSDTAGKLITQTSTNPKVAIALEAAGAADQIITVKIIPVAG